MNHTTPHPNCTNCNTENTVRIVTSDSTHLVFNRPITIKHIPMRICDACHHTDYPDTNILLDLLTKAYLEEIEEIPFAT